MSPELLSPIIEILAKQLAEQMQELSKQIPVYKQYSFVFPNPNELAYLLNNNDSYQEYSLALAWIEDILLNYTERLIKPTLSPEEAKHRYFDILRQAENEILAENLSMNYAAAIRLSQLVQSDKELGTIMTEAFLDDIVHWLNHFRETVRTGDKTIIQNYTTAKATLPESSNEMMLIGEGTPPPTEFSKKPKSKKTG